MDELIARIDALEAEIDALNKHKQSLIMSRNREKAKLKVLLELEDKLATYDAADASDILSIIQKNGFIGGERVIGNTDSKEG